MNLLEITGSNTENDSSKQQLVRIAVKYRSNKELVFVTRNPTLAKDLILQNNIKSYKGNRICVFDLDDRGLLPIMKKRKNSVPKVRQKIILTIKAEIFKKFWFIIIGGFIMFENNYFNTQENTTAKSPFSVYAEENHKLILPEKRTSLDEIDFLLDKGYIGENEKLLLIITNNMCFATSRQLTQMFNLAGFNIDQAKTQSMLKKLKTKSFIKQVEFYNQSNESMKSSFRAYTLGQHGVGILYASQIKPKLQGYINAMSTSTIKRLLL